MPVATIDIRICGSSRMRGCRWSGNIQCVGVYRHVGFGSTLRPRRAENAHFLEGLRHRTAENPLGPPQATLNARRGMVSQYREQHGRRTTDNTHA